MAEVVRLFTINDQKTVEVSSADVFKLICDGEMSEPDREHLQEAFNASDENWGTRVRRDVWNRVKATASKRRG